MRFLIDAQLPPALARWLVERGESAEHVADVDLLEAEDAEIWRFASSAGAVIVTKDEDFALRVQIGGDGPQVAWVRSGNVRNAELLRRWSELWPAVTAALQRGERLVEIG